MVDREAAARAIEAFLRALGRDPERHPEFAGTGDRVASAWADELLAGYAIDVDALVAPNVFPGTTELVVVRSIPVTTMCPHHLLPSSGEATVAFAPNEYLIGVGTVAAVVDAFARRLAMQESLGDHVAATLQKHLAPRWVACRVVLTHACMTARGERAHGARVETLALHGGEVDVEEVQAALGAPG
ncbi:MAG TPA: GTP cyclohydrolase I [Polyangiaceae bacterium]|jgi:GTP cyclohydrolase I